MMRLVLKYIELGTKISMIYEGFNLICVKIFSVLNYFYHFCIVPYVLTRP